MKKVFSWILQFLLLQTYYLLFLDYDQRSVLDYVYALTTEGSISMEESDLPVALKRGAALISQCLHLEFLNF